MCLKQYSRLEEVSVYLTKKPETGDFMDAAVSMWLGNGQHP
jgi:hypothetical protein